MRPHHLHEKDDSGAKSLTKLRESVAEFSVQLRLYSRIVRAKTVLAFLTITVLSRYSPTTMPQDERRQQ